METTQDGASPGVSDHVQTFENLFQAGAFEPKPPQEQAPAPIQPAQAEPKQKEAPAAPAVQEVEPDAPELAGKDTEEEEKGYSSLDELLTEYKLDPESVRSLPVTVKIDGQEKLVPLAEVLKSYQLEGHVNNKSIELSNQQKAFEAEQTAARELLKSQLQQNQALGQLAQQQLNYEFNQVDWNGLRATDPARYAALMTDYQSRQGQVAQYLSQVGQQQQQEQLQQQQALTQRLATEREKLMEARPQWKDPAAFKTATESMSKAAKALGFTDAEIGQVSDHRVMLMLEAAASHLNLQAKQPEALKRVREAPKMGKPGARQTTDPKTVLRQQAVERFNANPRDVDAQAALFSALAGE